jgi:hypothetical protein
VTRPTISPVVICALAAVARSTHKRTATPRNVATIDSPFEVVRQM